MTKAIELMGLSVYLVEPSGIQAKIIVGHLNALGIDKIRSFRNGEDVLAAMAETRPDLVISALYLPDITGTDLVTTMRGTAAFADVAFILISSETRPQALEAVRQAGVCGILPKPFAAAQLRTAIASTLDYLRNDDDHSDDLDVEGLHVLLVDDSPSARKFMRRVLENLGIEHFTEAEDGRQAVAILADTQFDLVVTDYNMPEMDGAALVEYIRKQSWQSSVPILMVTSETSDARLAAVEDAGVSGICDKPFEPAVVRRILTKVLAGA
jgi:two-component system chemotaxis response regulator CheY